MDNMNNAIEGFRRRTRYDSGDNLDYLPSQEEDVFSFRQLQLHQHKKKTSNRQKQQIKQRTSMYDKIVAELSQNPNSDHLQLVGSCQDLDKNGENENQSITPSSMSGNNHLLSRHLSIPEDRLSTYDRIVNELSIDRSRSIDGSVSVIGGDIVDNLNTNEDGTGLILDDYDQLKNKEFPDVVQESHVPPLIVPNFVTLDMLNEQNTNTINTESGRMNYYTSKEMKNYVNNMSKLQVEGTYDDHMLNQENKEFSQICDQNLVNQVSSMNIYPTGLPKDESIVNNQLSNLNSYSLNSNARLYENSNQHLSTNWSDHGNQNLNSSDMLSIDHQESQSSKYNSVPHSTFNSLELNNNQSDKQNAKERRSNSLIEYLSPSTNVSWVGSTSSQNFREHDGAESLAESSSKEWGVSGAIKGIITGVFGEKVNQTSPERAQQVKEIADLNIIFRY